MARKSTTRAPAGRPLGGGARASRAHPAPQMAGPEAGAGREGEAADVAGPAASNGAPVRGAFDLGMMELGRLLSLESLADAPAAYPDVEKANISPVSTPKADDAGAWASEAWSKPVALPSRGRPHVQRTRAGEVAAYCARIQRQFFLDCVGQCPATAAFHGRWRKWVPCGQLDCETCQDLVRRRRGGRLHTRFGGTPVMGFWTLTIPNDLCAHVGASQAIAIRRRAVQVLAEWTADWTGTERGWIAAFHPCGDKDPTRWRPHIHVASPCVGRLADGTLVKVHGNGPRSGMIPQEQLDDLRARWGAVLNAIADAAGVQDKPASNVHYQFASRDAQVLHHLSYNARPFPAWYAGNMPRALRLVSVHGLAAPNARRGIQWRALVKRPKEDDETAEGPTTCPCCAGPLAWAATVAVGSADWRTWRGAGAPLLDSYVTGESDLDTPLSALPPEPWRPPDDIPY